MIFIVPAILQVTEAGPYYPEQCAAEGTISYLFI